MLEKMERLLPPVSLRRSISIRYPECVASGKVVLELRHARKAYGDQIVFRGADLKILRHARVALVGPNGAGKSTLMRLLSGREAPDAGERVAGFHAEIAFFAQDEGSRFDPGATVYESVLEAAPTAFVPQVRGLLGAFLFSGDAVEKCVGALSGGELNRLAIAALLVRPSNLLLLDEPTNHLDLAAKDALLDSLRAYPGTIVFVSHDRHFLDGLATHVVEVGGGGLYEYPGTYPSYLWHRHHKSEAKAAGVPGAPATPAAPGAATPPAPAARGGRDRGRGPSRQQRIESLERAIADLESRKQRFARVLSDPALFTDRDKGDFYLREYQEAEGQLARLYAQWEKLHAEAGETG
jgi:ATP-binding cassette subfamily F protein 3